VVGWHLRLLPDADRVELGERSRDVTLEPAKVCRLDPVGKPVAGVAV
jgi:hypothetical protein